MKFKEQPDKEGYYWIYCDDDYGWDMVVVFLHPKGIWYYTSCCGVNTHRCDAVREWYGPIRKPGKRKLEDPVVEEYYIV